MQRDRGRPAWEERGDVNDELSFHLEMTQARLEAEGMDAREASAEARRRFGDQSRVANECRLIDRRLSRRERRADVLSDLVADLGRAIRILRNSPTFMMAAVASLALASGATTALYTVVHSVLLSPLPYERPLELAELSTMNSERGWDGMPLPPGVFDELESRPASAFELAVYRPHRATLLSGEQPRRLEVAAVSTNLVPLLGVEPLLGRHISAGDLGGVSGAPCLISERMWKRDLSGSSEVLGSIVQLEGDVMPCVVIGVLPRAMDYPTPSTDLWTKFETDPEDDPWGHWSVRGLVRLDSSATSDAAAEELAVRSQAWKEQMPFGDGWSFELQQLHERIVGDVAPALWVLFSAVLLVLLIACINLGSLLIARTTERRGELAVRSALGASRGRLARQLFAETLLLCTVGGVFGLLLAQAAITSFQRAAPIDLPRLETVEIDARVLGFALAVTLATSLLSWLGPLSQALNGRLLRSDPGPQQRRLHHAFVIVESALAVALLIGAGLLGRSFLLLTAVDPGFQLNGTAAARIELPPSRYPDAPARLAFADELLERVHALPMVEAAGLTTGLPLHGVAMIDRLQVAGTPIADDQRPQVAIDAVTPGYFDALGIEILQGRGFDRRDAPSTADTVIVNQRLVDGALQADADPLRQRIMASDDESSLEIVGVSANLRQFGLRTETPLAYFIPFARSPRGTAHLVVRGTGSGVAITNAIQAIQAIVADMDASLPPPILTPLERSLTRSIAKERFYSWAMAGFAVLAALLAALGIYGIVSFTVERRKRELGIRLALGAVRSEVFGRIVLRGVVLAAVGGTLGAGIALGLSRTLDSLLFGIGANDPITFLAGPVLAIAIAIVATLVPAQRAIHVDPARTLRSE